MLVYPVAPGGGDAIDDRNARQSFRTMDEAANPPSGPVGSFCPATLVSVVTPCYNCGRFLPGCGGRILAHPVHLTGAYAALGYCAVDLPVALTQPPALSIPRSEPRRIIKMPC